MKYIFTLIIFQMLSILSVFSIWQRNIISYERSTYQAGFQNWMVAQSGTGWLYFANSKGLLEFDGVYWNVYPVKNKTIRSLKIVGNRIYIGASSEFGYFEPDSMGKLTYHSLSENLKDWWGEVWNIFVTKDKIYFLDDNNINICDSNEEVTLITTNIKIDCSSLIGGRIYLGSTEGVFYLNDEDGLKLMSRSQELFGTKIVGIQEYNNRILVTTARSGLYFLDDKNCEKIHSKADLFISQNQIFCSAVNGSKIVLGSVQNGAFLFDLDNPSYSEAFNLSNGLRNNTVLSAAFDKKQNLWLGLDKGIGYVDLTSPIHPLFPVNSPIGTGYCSVSYNNELYLGTNQGLYKMDENGYCHMIPDSEGQIWSLSILDNSLFSAGDNCIMVITPRYRYKINLTGVWGIQPLSSDNNRLIVATYSGFRILEKKNGMWAYSHSVSDFSSSSRGFIEDDVSNTFWMVNTLGDIQRLTINPENGKLINLKKYSLKDGVIGENVYFRKIQNSLIICSDKGIYQYSRILDEFTPYSQLESLLNGAVYYDFLDTDDLNNIWFVSDKNLKMLLYEKGSYTNKIYNWGLSNELIDSFENITLLDSTSAIVAVDKGYFKIDLTKKEAGMSPVNAFIRKVVTTDNDSIVAYNKSGNFLSIPYSHNSINIYFAATEYSQASDVVYSYRMKNTDIKWSIPSSKAMKEYTNLTEGEYTFEVKAFINGFENYGNIATITFEILPPWYRSTWAYFVYTISFVVFLLLLYRQTIKKQKLIIIQKGEELEAQSRQYNKERMLKDKEIYELQNENLRTNLNFKTQELTGYILNLIRKNEMLEEVKREVLSISKSLDENKQHGVIKQKVIRLTTQINNNIERDKDFELFQSNFNLIHKDFFKLLDEKYPHLTRNDKILCAYLKMNLSSKEIAPLLNISLRGVEINRYRLRKKMDLDRDINLTEFMQNLS